MSDDLETRMRTAEGNIIDLRSGQSGHEKLCAERYDRIKESLLSGAGRMKRMEVYIIGACGSGVLILLKTLFDMITRQ